MIAMNYELMTMNSFEQAGHRVKRSERRVAVPTNKEERGSDGCE